MQRDYNVRYRSERHSREIATDEVAFVECTITNLGQDALSHSSPTKLVNAAYRWRDAQGRLVVGDGQRTPLPETIAPGASATIDMQIEPPLYPGSYTLEIDLVAEQYAWFADLGIAPLQLPVHITQAQRTKPHVCIINTNLVLNDAVANNVMDQVRFFRSQGYQVSLLVEWVADRGIPSDIRQVLMPIRYSRLREEIETGEHHWATRQFLNADIYIFHYPVYYELAEAISTIQHGTIIFDYHGITPPEFWNDPETLPLLIRGQERAVLANYADYAIVHSEYMRSELQQHSGIASAKVRVLPYVVPLEHFVPQPPETALLDTYDLHGMFVLLYIGRMAGNKRINDLVRMLANVQRTYPNTVLMLIGNNTTSVYKACADEALQIAEELGCRDSVIFTGAIAHDQLPRFYNLAHVYVTSSLHEGFCVPVIEAMSCGKPVVATDTTALPSTVGNAGLLFPARDAAAMATQVLRLLTTLQPHQASALSPANRAEKELV